MTPAERSMRARIAAHTQWAKEADPTARTSTARRAFDERFEREADPDGTLAPAERARRAAQLRSAYFTRLALKSAKARRLRAEVEAELADIEEALGRPISEIKAE